MCACFSPNTVLNIAGTTSKTISDETINPPIIAKASEDCEVLFAGSTAKGSNEAIVVTVVIKTARNFFVHAEHILSAVPVLFFLRICITVSYSKMELFTAVPNKMIKATVLFIFSVFPKTAKKIKAPEKAGGKASNNKSGMKKDSNCAAITKYKSIRAAAIKKTAF